MRWLIYALGVALALAGAASIVSGGPYIRIESGWTEVIAGTTALSAGIMTLGLGAILSALRRLEAGVVGNGSSVLQHSPDVAIRAAEPMPLSRVVTDRTSNGSDVASYEPDVPVSPDIPLNPASRTLAERLWSKRHPLSTPEDERAEPPVVLDSFRSTDRSFGGRTPASAAERDHDASLQPEPGNLGVAAPQSYARPGAASLSRADADDRIPSFLPPPQPPAGADFAGSAPTTMEAPTVVGRYESGGASYVLFSDGTIEVETDVGTHRFASMVELKAYIDQQQKSAIG